VFGNAIHTVYTAFADSSLETRIFSNHDDDNNWTAVIPCYIILYRAVAEKPNQNSPDADSCTYLIDSIKINLVSTAARISRGSSVISSSTPLFYVINVYYYYCIALR